MNLRTSLQTSLAQRWEEHRVIFQMYSTVIVIKQPILQPFCSIHYLSVMDSFQQCIVDELINYWHAPCFRFITLNTRCYTSQ